MPELISTYDTALFDLDGVLYLGPHAIPGAAQTVRGLRERGVRVGFITNNAARAPLTVAEHLSELGIEAGIDDVVTSGQAGAKMLARSLPPGAKVLVVGTHDLADEVKKVGLHPVASSADGPDAVLQGYDPEMTWPRLDDACYAIQAGARWFATNLDANRPTERGRVAGAGAQIAVVATSVPGAPEVAGKPFRPLLDETVERLGARRPIFVGDRIDTDIVGAHTVGMDSLFVFTGTHGKYDLAAADAPGRPTYIGADASALLALARTVRKPDPQVAECGEQRAIVRGDNVELATTPDGLDQQLDALWALLALLWDDANRETDALAGLDLVP